MNRRSGRGRALGERDGYVTNEEFARLFETEQAGLQQLAILLTANPDAADKCLCLALQQCLASSFVFKGWALTWARRVIIRSAIRLVIEPVPPLPVETNGELEQRVTAYPRGGLSVPIVDGRRVQGLSEFDRFVFVVCALERYSAHNCAVLLGRSLRDIKDALQRTTRGSWNTSMAVEIPRRSL